MSSLVLPPTASDAGDGPGERVDVPERLVVGPCAGRFRPLARSVPGGLLVVDVGELVGEVLGPAHAETVRSPFRGLLMGMLAGPRERVRPGQPVAWLRIAT